VNRRAAPTIQNRSKKYEESPVVGSLLSGPNRKATMTEQPSNDILRHLRGIVSCAAAGGLPDAELLRRYVATGDQAAFEVVLWRHGPAVLSLCRRMLQRTQDAEDAFQATFLALVRKAASIGRRQALASWLYKVAFHVCLRARRKLAAERAVEPLGDVAAAVPDPSADVLSVLDEEVNRLPHRYRQLIVGCYIEGKTNAAMARELGCPPGTVYSRLDRARARLRERLARRGASAGALAGPGALAVFTPSEAPAALVASTMQLCMRVSSDPAALAAVSPAIVALTRGALNVMWYAKLKKAACAAVLVSLAVLGASVTYSRATSPGADGDVPAGKPTLEPPPVPAPKPEKPAESLKISLDVPKQAPTVAEVNNGRFKFTLVLENTGKQLLVLYPYMSPRLTDPDGKDVKRAAYVGRYGDRSKDSIIEETPFVTLKSGETVRWTMSVANFEYHPDAHLGWQLAEPGTYRLELHYAYNRAAARKQYGAGCKELDDPTKPWNRAVEIDRKFEIEIRATK
jgi:RNA polymerase sigma factor (sigma-70 family)